MNDLLNFALLVYMGALVVIGIVIGAAAYAIGSWLFG